MATETPKTPQKTASGYGKRSKLQWVLIYVVVAVIVYGLIYFLFFRSSGNSGSGGGGLSY